MYNIDGNEGLAVVAKGRHFFGHHRADESKLL